MICLFHKNSFFVNVDTFHNKKFISFIIKNKLNDLIILRKEDLMGEVKIKGKIKN